MKKAMISLLAALLLLLCACAPAKSGEVTFFYPRSEIAYNVPDGVIASETRSTTGHTLDVGYLVSLYLMGPMSQKLSPAFPQSTGLVSYTQSGGRLQLFLTDTAQTMTDSAYALSCACLARTCVQGLGVEEVTISSGARTLTLRDNILLTYDEPFPDGTTVEDTK